jgi:hypothetical protein
MTADRGGSGGGVAGGRCLEVQCPLSLLSEAQENDLLCFDVKVDLPVSEVKKISSENPDAAPGPRTLIFLLRKRHNNSSKESIKRAAQEVCYRDER